MECFLPALSSLRGTNPAHEHRLPAEGNLFISTPISEMILKAVNLLEHSGIFWMNLISWSNSNPNSKINESSSFWQKIKAS